MSACKIFKFKHTNHVGLSSATQRSKYMGSVPSPFATYLEAAIRLHTPDTLIGGCVQNRWALLLPFVYIYLFFIFTFCLLLPLPLFKKQTRLTTENATSFSYSFFSFVCRTSSSIDGGGSISLWTARASFSRWIGYLCWYRRSFVFSLISAVALFGLWFYRFTSDDWIWYSVSVEMHCNVRRCTI